MEFGAEMVWILLGAGVVLLATLSFGRDAAISRRILFQFLFNVALPVIVLLAVPLVLLSGAIKIDARIWQALIAGLVIATGWLTTSIFAELERKRARAEKLRDYHKALYAEIRNSLAVFWQDGNARKNAARLVREMRRNPGFVPLLPHEVHDRIYTSVIDEIETLPRVTIDIIVAYYSLISAMSALAEDMRSDRYLAGDFDQTRRIRLYLDFFGTRNRAYLLGQSTLAVIDAYAKGGETAAARALSALNTRDGGQNGRQQARV